MTGISNLQIRRAKFDSTKMTDLNHWNKHLAVKPEIFHEAHRLLFASKSDTLDLSKGNILENIFGLGKTKFIDDLTWSWKMKVEGFRPITIIENRTQGSTPGKHRQPIKVLVDADLAVIGETWSPGSSDKSQVVTVVNKKKEGRGFEYTLKTYTEGENHFIDPKYLEPGSMWTRMFTIRGEAAESGGHTEMATPIEYKNSLVKIRKQYKVTDYGGQAVLEIGFKDNTGKAYRSWMDMQEAEYHMAMNKETALLAMYSRLGDQPMIDPDSGYPMNPGAGLQQQIGFGGNIERFNVFSAELLEAFFQRIVYSRITPGDLGEVVGWSGQYGMAALDKAIKRWVGEDAVVRNSEQFLTRDLKGVHSNSLAAGYQYTLYKLPNGGTFRLMYNPLNDDKKIHRDIDPTTGTPLESQRVTILDVTGGNGQSLSMKDNICLVRKNKVQGVTMVPGRVGPGGIIAKNPTHSGDFYRVDLSDSVGIQVTDPTLTGELIKTI